MSGQSQPVEADGTVNSVVVEPKVKGRDIRKKCLGCGYFHHLESAELRCLRQAIASLSQRLEEFRGKGMCMASCCQQKAMYCRNCAK
jgi:hypothetical protein